MAYKRYSKRKNKNANKTRITLNDRKTVQKSIREKYIKLPYIIKYKFNDEIYKCMINSVSRRDRRIYLHIDKFERRNFLPYRRKKLYEKPEYFDEFILLTDVTYIATSPTQL